MRTAVVLAVAAAAAGAGVAALLAARGSTPPTADYRGSEPPAGLQLPEFSLRDHTGARVTTAGLRGKAVLVTFLDSQCEEACPVIAAQIARALSRLEPGERRAVAAVAITTDPAEDTPTSIRAFLRRQGAAGKLRYLVGSERELRPLWREFGVLASVDSGSDDVHSAPVRIYDPRGAWVATQHAGADLSAANLLHDVRLALRA